MIEKQQGITDRYQVVLWSLRNSRNFYPWPTRDGQNCSEKNVTSDSSVPSSLYSQVWLHKHFLLFTHFHIVPDLQGSAINQIHILGLFFWFGLVFKSSHFSTVLFSLRLHRHVWGDRGLQERSKYKAKKDGDFLSCICYHIKCFCNSAFIFTGWGCAVPLFWCGSTFLGIS